MKLTTEQLNRTEEQIKNNFQRYKRKDNRFRVAIEEANKVQKIEALKDYLNTNFKDYTLAISFVGGSFWKEYSTILAIEVLE